MSSVPSHIYVDLELENRTLRARLENRSTALPGLPRDVQAAHSRLRARCRELEREIDRVKTEAAGRTAQYEARDTLLAKENRRLRAQIAAYEAKDDALVTDGLTATPPTPAFESGKVRRQVED
jgi:phage host-nuclease inhibitor protein Gam